MLSVITCNKGCRIPGYILRYTTNGSLIKDLFVQLTCVVFTLIKSLKKERKREKENNEKESEKVVLILKRAYVTVVHYLQPTLLHYLDLRV